MKPLLDIMRSLAIFGSDVTQLFDSDVTQHSVIDTVKTIKKSTKAFYHIHRMYDEGDDVAPNVLHGRLRGQNNVVAGIEQQIIRSVDTDADD